MPSRIVIDTNTPCAPHVATLKKRGVTHIGRYYASSKWKRIVGDEAKALSDAGFLLVSIFEDSGKPPLSIEAGKHDAGIALAQAEACGQPKGTAIYFAMENLPSGYGPSHLPGLQDYFRGVNQVLNGHYKVGAYSNGLTLQTLLDASLIQYAWVSASTSFVGSKAFLKTPRWHLAQRLIDKDWEGVSVDTNDAQGDDLGAWTLNPDAPVVVATAGEAADELVAQDNQPPEPPVPDRSEPKEPLWKKFGPLAAADKIQDLDAKGSRIAASINTAKSWFWRLASLVGGGSAAASQLLDTSQGTGGAISRLASAHPFAFAGGAVAVVGILGYVAVIAIQRGLLSAHADGRYKPRGQ